MESTEDRKTLGQILDGLGVVESETLDLSKFYTVGAIVLLKVVPMEGDSTAPDLAVCWNDGLDYISRVGMVKIAGDIIDAGVYLEAQDDDED